MATASIQLTDHESEALNALAEQTGKTTDELLREAVTRMLIQTQPTNRLVLLQQARGIWKDRQDIPDVRALREEFDRFASQE